MAHFGVVFSVTLLLLLACSSRIHTSEAQAIGVNYGLLGDNLPSPDKVYASLGIKRLRLFNPDSAVLTALQGSGIDVILRTYNEELQRLGADQSYAATWVRTNVVPYAASVSFRYINAGNEVIPGDLAVHVLPAMQNLDAALRSAGVQIPVTTALATQVLGVSYPPSDGSFSEAAAGVMAPIAAFLQERGVPLLVNVYPYFAYVGNPSEIRLDYALFTAPGVVVHDGALGYTNLFDAIVDSMYAALEKSGASNVEIVVSETGWPSGGGDTTATVENASVYNNNVVAHVTKNEGTPRRPGKATETYLFEMFNENQKPAGTERNFGLFSAGYERGLSCKFFAMTCS